MTSPFASVNHIGFVVKDLDAGVQFFVDVLGFTAVENRRGKLEPNSDILTRRFGVDATASGRFAFLRLDDSLIELLEWTAPDQNTVSPRNSDVGGRHIAITVTDIPAALDRLRKVEGVSIREPNDAGYIYCSTPLGLEIQLIPSS